MRTSIPGFDYRTQQSVALSARAWRDEMNALIQKGGFRYVINGETFVKMKVPGGFVLALEIHTNIAN